MPGLGKQERVHVYEMIDKGAASRQINSFIKAHAKVVDYDKERNCELLDWLRKMQWHDTAEILKLLLEG